MQWAQKQKGFTIVELLIVIVVIAILAAVTIVAYTGIQNRAKSSAAQSAAQTVFKKVSLWQIENPGQSPSTTQLEAMGFSLSATSGTTYQYTPGSAGVWCLNATANNVSYYTSSTVTTPTAGACAGHGVDGVPPITNIITNPRAVSGGGAWTNQTPASGSVSYVSNGAQDGGSAYQVITTTVGQLRIGIPRQSVAIVDGDRVSVGVDLYAPVAAQVQIEIGTSTGLYPKSSAINVAVGWNRVEGTVTIPSGGAGTISLVQIVSVQTSLATGQWRASRAIATLGTTVYGYADGTTPGWVWNGTANNSSSTGPPQ